jgi:DNA invertase Pin-like site-specific DNA recombinase
MHQIGGRFTSCESQEAICREHIQRNADLGWYEVASHSDPAYSGGSMKRPGMDALKRQIAAGEVKIVILFMLERVLRDTDEWSTFRKFLQEHGCTLESPTSDISEAEPEGRLKNNIVMSVAEYARLSTAKKVKIKMLEQAKRGIWNGGWLPYGYAYDKNTQALLPHPVEAPVVRRIFEQAAQLVPLQEIANALNAEGLRTRQRPLRRRDGSIDTIGGNIFRGDGLRILLRNPIYRGSVRFKGQDFAAKHEALVSSDLWDKANAAVQSERATPPESRLMVDVDTQMHLLKGIVYCGSCGRTLVPHDSGKKNSQGRPYRYYYCGFVLKERQPDLCAVGKLPADALEKVTMEFLGQLSRHPDLVALVIENAKTRRKADRPVLQEEANAIQGAMEKVKKKLANCVDAVVNAGLDAVSETFKQRMTELDGERQRLTVALERKRHELAACDAVVLGEKRVLDALDRLGALLPQVSPAEQKELCRLLIDRLEVWRAEPVSVSGRNVVHFRMKLHLPRLVEGMEERAGDAKRPNQLSFPSSVRGVNFEAQVDFKNAARGQVEILIPFRQVVRVGVVSRMPASRPAPIKAQTELHPIHEVVRWQRKLDAGEVASRAALAKGLGMTRAAVTLNLRLLDLVPEIREHLLAIKTAQEVRQFSLSRMRRLAQSPAAQQRRIFAGMRIQ